MNPERWSRIVELLDELHAALPEQRNGLLSALARDDPALAEEVRGLLAHADSAPSFLDAPVLAGQLRAPATPEDAVAGDAPPHAALVPVLIEGYRIVRLLGAGGMGSVYEAEQDHPRRRVALKFVRSGLLSARIRRRFEHEVEHMARLDHPGVARVHAAGIAGDGADGVPWLAMELVPGARPITVYVREENLSRRARLALFVEVAEAVFHAHQKGIVHRDLKPSNVLVDERGRPRVIDFGVARALDAGEPATQGLTQHGQLVGTVGYMSPEQCAADPADVDTRSDVYSLGVLLLEMLAGTTPHDVSGTPLHEAVRRVREDPPRRPSAIDPKLRGDLETILLTALEKDRERRYSTALDLAEDVRRYLASLPLSARPPSRVRRLALFVRRHRAASGAAVISVLALLGAVIVSGIFGVRSVRALERERQAAERSRREAATSERVLALFAEMFAEGDPAVSRGAETTVVEALERASDRLARETALEPEARARLMETLGAVFRSLGALDLARRELEGARKLRAEVLGGDTQGAERLLQHLVELYDDLGETGRAVELARRLLALRRDANGPDHRETLIAQASLGTQLLRAGDLDQAEALLAATETRWRAVVAAGAAGDGVDEAYLGLVHNLALVDRRLGRLEAAEERLRGVLEHFLERGGEDHPNVLRLRANLAVVLTEQGRSAEAEVMYRALLEAQQRVLGPGHPQALNTRFNRALLLIDLERFVESEQELLEVEEGQRRVLNAGHPWIGSTLHSLGFLYSELDRTEELTAVLLRLLAHLRLELGDDHQETVQLMAELASHLAALDRLGEARALAQEAVERTPPGDPAAAGRVALLESLR